jgi:hypothetical protein
MKVFLLLAVVAFFLIAIFGDGGVEVSPKVSTELRSDFNLSTSNDNYKIETYVENQTNVYGSGGVLMTPIVTTSFQQFGELGRGSSILDVPANATINYDEATSTPRPLSTREVAATAVSTLQAEYDSLESMIVWAEQNKVELPKFWWAWTTEARLDWLKDKGAP